jgi:hypothetical protein
MALERLAASPTVLESRTLPGTFLPFVIPVFAIGWPESSLIQNSLLQRHPVASLAGLLEFLYAVGLQNRQETRECIDSHLLDLDVIHSFQFEPTPFPFSSKITRV